MDLGLNLRPRRALVTTLALACGLLTAKPARAQITVYSAQADTTTNILSVDGSPFGSGLREFLYVGTFVELPVLTLTPTHTTATLPVSITPGTHLLILYQPSTGKAATFEVAIAAVGPPGPPGQDGAPGPPGVNGQNGVSVQSTALAVGDSSCPNGGSRFVAANGTTYACNGAAGTGADGSIISAGGFIIDSTALAQTIFDNGWFRLRASCRNYGSTIGNVWLEPTAAMDLVYHLNNDALLAPGRLSAGDAMAVPFQSGWRWSLQLHFDDGHAATLWITDVYRPAQLGCVVNAMGIFK
jgi:hypothetical protein